MGKYMKSLPALLLLCSVLPGLASYAQAPPLPPGANPPAIAGTPGENPSAASAAEALPPITLTPEEMKAPFHGSFFLTPAEIAAIKMALAGSGSAMGGDISAVIPVPPHRVISVSGLLYRSPKDWIVWMNGQKVTPENLLPEIVDIKIDSSSHMKLKWYDIGLDKVIAITLRPHQTYDIVTGVLLPGTE
ncbi:MAG: hypothetical protein K8R48_10235 [Alphaproteobacteria bacterium]|nr:hypothetical protein [Alphaproteobacteria bacterium]